MQNTKVGSGSVVGLWRYPVKSMMGEELNATEINERGLLADRAYALVDLSTGKIISAKNPRKWPNIFDFRAALVESPRAGHVSTVRITLPDGDSAISDRPDIDQTLSRALGRDVTLKSTAPEAPSLEEYWPDIDGLANRETITDETMALAAPGTFFDCAAVHLLTTATLDRLHEVYPQGRFEARRFRPNIVVRPPVGEKGFLENDWVGRTIVIGGEVRLKVIGPCPRCVMTTLAQGDLPQDVGILRAIARHNNVSIPIVEQEMPSVGIYASVSHSGLIRRGDPVEIE